MNAKQLIGSVLDTILKIVVIIAVIMLTYKYASGAYQFGYDIFAQEPMTTGDAAKTISIAITDDATTMDIGKVLEDKGLVSDAKLFYVQELLSINHGNMKPGIYELSSDMTAKEMIDILSAENSDEESEVSGEEVSAE